MTDDLLNETTNHKIGDAIMALFSTRQKRFAQTSRDDNAAHQKNNTQHLYYDQRQVPAGSAQGGSGCRPAPRPIHERGNHLAPGSHADAVSFG